MTQMKLMNADMASRGGGNAARMSSEKGAYWIGLSVSVIRLYEVV